MGFDLFNLLSAVAGREVVVVGDTILDVYLRGATRGICREAPAPVVAIQAVEWAPGGAANTAVNVAALGGVPRLVSATGADVAGCQVRAEMTRRGVCADRVIEVPERASSVKRRVVVGNHILVRLDEGDTGPLADDAELSLHDALRAALAEGAEALIVSDNGCGTLSARTVRLLAELRHAVPVAVVDAREPRAFAELRATATTPNYAEATRLLGVPGLDDDAARVRQITELGTGLLDATSAELVVVTLGLAGAVLFERGRPPFHSRVRHRTDEEIVGAGDVFAAALTLALTAHADPPAAVEFATAVAASAASTIRGTAVCSRAEVDGRLRETVKVLAGGEVAGWAAAARERGQRIVFTNGCFDLIHEGHVMFLNQAKALGDVLIVGVNDDESVREVKGPGRPVVHLLGRLRVLAALSCVDAVVAFSESSPIALIEAVRPDVFAKGGDYAGMALPEATVLDRIGADVCIVDYLDDRSTSWIIERVRAGA